MSRYLVFDLETQTHTHLKRKGSPFHPQNYIVAMGWKHKGDPHCSWKYNDKPGKYFIDIAEDVNLLVGTNIKFDLLWQWDNPQLIEFFKRGGRIWDCQYVEYLINGHSEEYHMAALTEMAPRYGGTRKIDEIKILWDRGVMTSDIDKDLLIDYLVGTEQENRDGGDVGNTEKVFLGQLKTVIDMGMLKAVQHRMDGLCATTEMEWNGLKIDLKAAAELYNELTAEQDNLYKELTSYVPETPPELEFNWDSRTHKSVLIFGGTLKYKKKGFYLNADGTPATSVKTEKWPLFSGVAVSPTECLYNKETGYYYRGDDPQDIFAGGKNKGAGKFKAVKVPGERKQKLLEHTFRFPGYVDPKYGRKLATTDAEGSPLYGTGSDDIQALEALNIPFCRVLTRYDALTKEIGTYLFKVDGKGQRSGMLTCVGTDHFIHHKLNHVNTVTSRLSSSDPNMQNLPRKDKSKIKSLFTSRFENGIMLEADYSQLEVVTQGALSRDKNLCEDLRNKIDFHCKRISIQPKYGKTYDEVVKLCKDETGPDYAFWKGIRTKNKGFSFQRAYGAGAASIALSIGMSKEDVEALISAEEATYPGVKRFNDLVAQSVNNTAIPFKDFSRDGKWYRRGTWTAPTGCIYSWRSWDPPEYLVKRGVEDSFTPTELKNYPIQGTGGEIVQATCGRIWRHLVSKDNYNGTILLCNTVHDCVWLDTDGTHTHEFVPILKELMEAVPEWFAEFDFKVDVPFPVEVEAGPNMLDLNHIH